MSDASETYESQPGEFDRPRSPIQWVILFLAPLLFCLIVLMPEPEGMAPSAWIVTGLLVWMALWWVSETIPIPITSLLPIVILPLFGIRTVQEATTPYGDRIVFLLLGGFIIAKSVERWRLHERLALLTVSRAGAHPAGLSLGFLVAAALLSAWISNTATSIMLMPVALSVAVNLGAERGKGTPLAVALCLSVAYGASIGGLATPVGTPTNLIVMGALEQAGHDKLTFANWMAFGVPTVLCLIPAAWFVLTRLSGPLGATDGDPQTVVREKLKALGPWTRPEVRTLMAFSVIAFFWIFRRAFIQDLTLFGVQPFAGLTAHVIAIAGAIAMFLIPAGCPNDRGAMILNWSTAKTLPWDVVLLFGGGLSLAAAITSTGLGLWIGDSLSALMSIPTLLIILMLTAMVIMATEVTSNVATAAALMPVVIALGAGSGVDPVALGVPVALAASCAFMFPMATAPNAIAFASGEVSIARMAIIGAKLNVLAIIIITLIAFVVTPMILG